MEISGFIRAFGDLSPAPVRAFADSMRTDSPLRIRLVPADSRFVLSPMSPQAAKKLGKQGFSVVETSEVAENGGLFPSRSTFERGAMDRRKHVGVRS